MSFSTYYDSTDTGLTGFTNVAGTVATFLDAVLVNGYNSKTLTSMTSSGFIVTATLVGHGYRDRQFVTISGATPSGYNGTWQIIVGSTSANTFQFTTVTSGMAAATGTLAAIVAPLGWAIAQTGTNLRAYQPAAGNRLLYRLDDTGTTSARVVGYESMTDVNTGTNPFPTAVQVAGGLFLSKSNAVTARRTILWGNASCFWVFSDFTGDSSAGVLSFFGDGTSYKTGDAWFSVVIAQSAAGTTEGSQGYANGAAASNFNAIAGHFSARSYTQIVGAVLGNKIADPRFTTNYPGGAYQLGGTSGSLTYPAPVDGNLWTSTLTMTETTATTPRGSLAGVVVPLHNRPLTNYTIFQGAGGLSGREFMPINLGGSGQLFAEVSNTF